MSEIWITCNCGDPKCPDYKLADLGLHPFFVPFDRSKYDKNASSNKKGSLKSIPFGVLKTSSWEFDGERTDLNDFLAVLWGTYLRCSGVANVSLLSERGFSIPTEVGSRAVIPVDWGTSYDVWEVEEKKLLLAKTSVHMRNFICRIFYKVSLSNELKKREPFDKPHWLSNIETIFSLGEGNTFELQTRQRPQWTCLTEIETGLTVVEISEESAVVLKSILGQKKRELHFSEHAMAIKDDQLKNVVDQDSVEKLISVLSVIDQTDARNAMIIPMSSHVVGIGKKSVVSIAAECGVSAFNKEIQRISESRKREDTFFMTGVECVWTDDISDERFEAMIGELVKAERGVIRARQVGNTREADDGRDFIAEWIAPHVSSLLDTDIEITEVMLSQVADILVQVKIRSRGVGRSDISGIRDSIEYHECTGMLFVAFPNITTTLHDHFNKLRKQDRWWIDWWNKADIEDRLRRNTSIASRYSDIVQLVTR